MNTTGLIACRKKKMQEQIADGRESDLLACFPRLGGGLAVVLALGCSPQGPEPDEVGKLVSYYNESGQELCLGTVNHIDDYLGESLFVFDVSDPSGKIAEYRWSDRLHPLDGYVERGGQRTVLFSGSAVHDHELMHAAHYYAWPPAPRFLHEGLADFFAESSVRKDPGTWRPTGPELDELLSKFDRNGVYEVSWVLVTQIILTHGFDGLRRFWFELEPSSSMLEVRETYTRLFGGSLDDLMLPYEATFNGETGLVEPGACRIRFCTGERLEWEDGVIEANGVSGCDDDDAVTPSMAIGQPYPWKDYVVQSATFFTVVEPPEGVFVSVEACERLSCDHYTVRQAGLADPPPDPWVWNDRYRIRVATDPDALPPGTEPTFRLVQQ